MRDWNPEVVEGIALDHLDPAIVDCLIASRLLGGNPYLVLFGGGNISVKNDDTIWVKASGHDMGSLTPEGLAPLDRVLLDEMFRQDSMTDSEMMRGYRQALRDPDYPSPSIETLLHNFLPQKFVLHTHSDAIVTLTNTQRGISLAEAALGQNVPVLPYVFPGFPLAQFVARTLGAQQGETSGFALSHHGLFTASDSAEQAYEQHRELVTRAESFIASETSVVFSDDEDLVRLDETDSVVGTTRDMLEDVFGGTLHVSIWQSGSIREFLEHPRFPAISQIGPTTLEHVIRTKRVPATPETIRAFSDQYREYFTRNQARVGQQLTMLEPVPNVYLDPAVGLVGLGRTESQAQIAAEIYRHSINIILAAERLGGYQSIDEHTAFDIEYWELEQARLSTKQ